MATTSQKIIEMRFLVRMRGALTPPPRMDEPVKKIPLEEGEVSPAILILPNDVWGDEKKVKGR